MKFVDPDGNEVITAYILFEISCSAYDAADVITTFNDPNSAMWEKGVSLGGFALGLATIGGGYGKLTKGAVHLGAENLPLAKWVYRKTKELPVAKIIKNFRKSDVVQKLWYNTKKLSKQIEKRGWSENRIKETIESHAKEFKTRDVRWDRVDGKDIKVDNGSATVYYKSNNDYVVVNDKTHELIQVSNLNDKEWKPDFGKWTEVKK